MAALAAVCTAAVAAFYHIIGSGLDACRIHNRYDKGKNHESTWSFDKDSNWLNEIREHLYAEGGTCSKELTNQTGDREGQGKSDTHADTVKGGQQRRIF
jgi:hypothetical protein